MTTETLLDESIRRKLEPLSLAAQRIRAGAVKGDRRSVRRGSSTEFADYRDYTPGDDLRRLDWNVYARLDKPVVKQLEDEEDLAVHLWLDTSASMGFPQASESGAAPDAHKLTFAKRLVAALSYIALAENDRLFITAGGTGFSGRGRAQIVPMLRFLQPIGAAGETDLNRALSDYALRPSRPGLMLIVSDLFSPAGYADGLNRLLGKGHEVVVIHTLSRDEIEPPLTGDLRLVDAETGTPQEVSLDDGLRELYARRLAEWQDGIRAECLRRGVGYIPVITDSPYERVLLGDLRRLGVVR